ncbi:hypothetical protein QE429_003420 [Bacillus sp. SORGH_AS 510]|uniref:TnsA endonuclease N-terminal domain-containing protein n=1 Tax=Bacillus sp. SORGH_AS_0510 TaxID=3041771 RepID=UPI00277FE9F2|nr:WYL domain-containing protein [Bacillus sp. SORGH_AS_0510]MDQ1146593.1 hypothetical protein [Bacillus sp. SORGH_AS_0510]
MKDKVVQGIRRQQCLGIKYKNEYREVEPFFLIRYDRKLYMVGYCRLRSDWRTFRISRMEKCYVLQQPIVQSKKPLKDLPLERFEHRESIQIIEEVGVNQKQKAVEQGYPKKIKFTKANRERLCRSPLEELVFKELENDSRVISFDIEPIKIPYLFKGKHRNYIPDVLIEYRGGKRVLMEIKLSGDIQAPMNQAKFRAAKEYAKEHGMTFTIRGLEGKSKKQKEWNDLDWEITKIKEKKTSSFNTTCSTPPSKTTNTSPLITDIPTSPSVESNNRNWWKWIIGLLAVIWILQDVLK